MIELTDISTYRVNDEGVPDLDPTFTIISGRQVRAEHVARRLETDTGALEKDPAYGFNITRRLGQRTSSRTLVEIQQGVEAQCLEEETIATARCVATEDATTKAITLRIHLTDDEGPWDFVLAIGDVTVEILRGPN